MAKLKKSDKDELLIALKELALQKQEKKKLSAELIIARKELAFQKKEKGNRAAELGIANIELAFQDEEKGKRAAELGIANKELVFQKKVKEKRAAELVIANEELVFQNSENQKREIAKKELEAYSNSAKLASQYSRSLIEASQDPLVTISTEGKITDMNEAMASITGTTREKLTGTDFFDYFTEPQKAREVYQEVFAKGFVTDYPLTIMDHKLTDVLFNGSVYKDEQGKVLGAVVVARDITEQKRIEKELIEAKVDAGKMTFEQTPFKMASSISAMLHMFEPKIQEKNLQLVKEYDNRIPEVLLGDPVRLHQIILNLLSNAVKFTSKGKITVSANLIDEDEQNVTIEFAVTDTGIGIPANKIEKIFENFQQASSATSRLYGGTGLGLSIVKQLIEPQGGSIRVKSKIDEGSAFSFTLDFQKTNADVEAEAEILELIPEIKNIKVLVVEDIALNQLLMKTLLDDFGFEQDIAGNGKIAIEKLTQKSTDGTIKSYDIILMDLQMPEMNGFDTTEYIRKTMNSNIPIIALTADVTTVDLAKCKAVGMNDYIAKPVDERILYSKIIGLVRKPAPIKYSDNKGNETAQSEKIKYTDLAYLVRRTKSDPKLMMEMISLYLEQTPPLITIMKKSFRNKDWGSLHATVHKMIPSFSIMGISTDFENMAKKIQDYASSQQVADGIHDMVLQLENVCIQACKELTEEFHSLKNAGS